VFFALLGSASIKAARKISVKLNLGVDFTNTLHAAFLTYSSAKKLQSQIVIRENLPKKLSCKKAAHKMLVKLTMGLTETLSAHLIMFLLKQNIIV